MEQNANGTRMVYFKVVDTTYTTQKYIDPDITTIAFKNLMNSEIPRIFGISDFDLVECGQPGRSEDGEALIADNTLLSTKYGPNLNVSFYIRPITPTIIPTITPTIIPTITPTIISTTPINVSITSQLILCTICMDEARTILFRPCNHAMLCRSCSDRIVNCHICRTFITERIQIFL